MQKLCLQVNGNLSHILVIFIPNSHVCSMWTRGSTATHHGCLHACATRFLSKSNHWALRDGAHQCRIPSYRPHVVHICTSANYWGVPVQQEGHSQCTCPSSGSSSHIRKQGEIKLYFRSYQVRDSKSSSNQLGHQRKYHKPSRALTWVLVNKLINLLLPEIKNYLTNDLNEGWESWCFSLEKAAGRHYSNSIRVGLD